MRRWLCRESAAQSVYNDTVRVLLLFAVTVQSVCSHRSRCNDCTSAVTVQALHSHCPRRLWRPGQGHKLHNHAPEHVPEHVSELVSKHRSTAFQPPSCLSTCLYACLNTPLCTCLYTCLTMCLSTCLSTCPNTFLHTSLNTSRAFRQPRVYRHA